MGLDMYLELKRYIWSSSDEDKKVKITGLVLPGKLKEITVEGIYWRKANAIHRWFVVNVQGGKDECHPHYVDIEQLKELKKLVDSTLKDRKNPEKYLPTHAGFFFGPTDYDEWYWKDLENTKVKLKDVINFLESPEGDGWSAEYSSSW